MANVDYVIVGAGPSPADVTQAVQTAPSVVQVEKERRYTRLRTGDERAEVSVWPRSWQPGVTVVEVYHVDDDDQRALARHIYDYLVDHTAWDLTLDSDNAAEAIASRVKTRT
ncbi:hypothetical protein ACAG26_01635 [Mycobacterium sp. pUA109]|uniref:hypothetical protein n=1 Tax=Mycobacterium sp. pUA109 TaxID=3238982 RepID=UPI00351B6000